MTRISLLSVALLGVTCHFSAPFAPRSLPRRLSYTCGNPTSLEDDDDDNDTGSIPAQLSPSTTSVVVRDTAIGRMALGIARTGMKDVDSLQVGDIVVAKYEIPSLQIWGDCGYEITGLYAQGLNRETGVLEKIPLATMTDKLPNSGYTRYLQIVSPEYHSEPVVVTPEEIGLVTLKAELQEAMLLAIPGFFWVFVASSFSHHYTDKYGGSFLDAFLRT